jgi:hypothetical protein
MHPREIAEKLSDWKNAGNKTTFSEYLLLDILDTLESIKRWTEANNTKLSEILKLSKIS